MPADLDSGVPQVTYSVLRPPKAYVDFDLQVTGAPAMYVDDPNLWPPRVFMPDHVRLVIGGDGSIKVYVHGGRKLSDGRVSGTTRDTRYFASDRAQQIPGWIAEVIAPCRRMANEMITGVWES